jgi:hypothetical protein
MTYEDFKFFIPAEKSTEEQLEELKNNIFALEASYHNLGTGDDTAKDREIVEAQIMAKRQEFEDLGGSYE